MRLDLLLKLLFILHLKVGLDILTAGEMHEQSVDKDLLAEIFEFLIGNWLLQLHLQLVTRQAIEGFDVVGIQEVVDVYVLVNILGVIGDVLLQKEKEPLEDPLQNPQLMLEQLHGILHHDPLPNQLHQ